MTRQRIAEFLKGLTDLGISCVLNGSDLDIKAPKGVMTKEVLSELKERKAEIIDYLSGVSLDTTEIKPIKNESEQYPISSAQRRLWVISQFEEASIGHNMPNTVHLSGNHDVESFSKAIHAVIERHEILRTVFRSDDEGEVFQVILPSEELDFSLKFHDCRSNREQADDLINSDVYKPFDLANGPLIRAMLIRIEEEKYIFHYNMHHIISDGWSGEVLSKDMFAYYDAFKKGHEVSHPSQIGLSELNIQYKDYASWQLAQLETEKFEEHKNFWLDRLGGKLSLLNLPSNKRRPRLKTYNGESLSLLIPSEVTEQLKQYVEQNGGSQFMLVLTLLNVLLYRYTGTTDVIIGSPIAGREHSDLEDQIGFYVNTLISRHEVDPNESFNQLYERVKIDTLSAYKHQMYPFDKLVEELDLIRDTSRSVVFDISLTYHNIYQESISREYGERFAGEVRNTGAKKVKNDIELHFQELGEYVSMDLFFNSDVYDEEIISNFMRHFQQLAEALLKSSNIPLSQVDFLRSDERKEQLAFNTETIPYPDSDSLVRLFEKQVTDGAENTALIYDTNTWTYAQLDEVSTQLANCLKNEYHVSSGDMVGVQVEKSDWAIIAFIAVLKAGGVYIPIDPNYPSDRKQYICEDSSFGLLITQTNFIYDIDYYEGEVFAIDVEFTPEDHSKELNVPYPAAEDLAYVIYTSGSTGKPKGVMISHKEISNSTLAQIDRYETGSSTNGLLFASLSFDTSLSEILMVLMAGGTLSIIGDSDRKDPQKLTEFIQKNKVTLATIPPSYVSQMDMDEISGLNKLITAGEPPNLQKAQSFLQYGTYFNAYGPTEAAICATVCKLEKGKQIEFGSIPIGKPLQNVELFILNEAGLMQPMGVAGEICIGGMALAKGYLNNPELTEKKFIQNELSSTGRIYRTGDLGRWLPDGNIEFLGRVDDQFKINGYRVEPGEIEHILLENRDIKAAAIIPQVTEQRITSMIAYIVPETAAQSGGEDTLAEINLNQIRSFLEKRLPTFMIPSEFILLDNLSLTPNGKIDKKALSQQIGTSLSTGIEFVAPSTENEKVLVSVLKDVLQRDQIGINDSFYNLGGDSVKSIQTVGRLKQQGYSLSVEHILKTPEVKTLAGFMTKTIHEVDQSEVSGDLELAPIQNWFFQHKGIKNHHHFNQSVVLRSDKAIDTKKLETCLTYLTTHHDLLRLSVSRDQENWKLYNRTSEEKAFSLDVHNIKDSENSDETIQSIGEELQSTFDLEKGPLFKVVQFQLKEYDLLGIIAHHLVVDGVSWRILLEDLQTLYGDVIQGLAPKLPKKTSSFQSWTAKLKEYSNSTVLQNERSYWEQIEQTSVDQLPVKVSADRSIRSTVSFDLGELYSEKLQTRVHHVYKTQINDLLLTALGVSLRETLGMRKTIIQMEGHGRENLFEHVDLSRTVGWFTSIYPFLLDISGNANWKETLVQVKDALRRVPNKGIGYSILTYLSQEGLSGEVAPQITFNFLGDFGSGPGGDQESSFKFANPSLGSEMAEENDVSALLDVSGIIVEGNLNISITYPRDAFEIGAIEELIKAFESNLKSIIEGLSSESQTYLTASDFTYKGLSFNEWNSLEKENIEDIYELSPLQKGIFFHWLTQESNSIYFEQTNYRIHAPELDTEKLKNAYSRLIDRHAVLRTSFSNEISDRPLQIVHKEVPIHFSFEKFDESSDLEEYLNQVKERDMDKGFDLASPSQMRLHIIELPDNRYEFIWSHHHILMDGWCISILINDFNTFLNQKYDENDPFPDVTKYSSYIEWLGQIDQDSSLSYWKVYLSGYEQGITFPFEKESSLRDRIQVQERLEITGELFKKMERLCNDLEITTSTFVQCAWGLLLAQYNNSNDVVFGKVVSGRPGELDGVEDIVGLFINTVPVRVSYDETDTVDNVLRRLQDEAIEGANHHYINLSEVQAQSELGMNLINHIMIYQNYAVQKEVEQGNGSNQDLRIESMEVFEQSNYDLNVVVGVASDSLTVNVRYDNNRYHSDGVKRSMDHLEQLVRGLIEQTDTPISEITCLSEVEKNHLLFELNDTESNTSDETVLDMIGDQVELSLDELAVSFGNEQLTYSDLERKSNQFADYLIQEYTIEKGDFVEVKIPRSEWILVAIIGIWKSGGVYVPVDPEYPEQRIKYIEEDANCKVAIGTEELTDFSSKRESYSHLPIQRKTDQYDLAYVIYTSGSTGRPKGTLINHGNLFEFLSNCKRKYPTNEKVIMPFVASISFDISLFQMFYPLVTGGQNIVVEKDTFQNPVAFQEILKSCTMFDTVPAMFSSIVDYVLSEDEPSPISSIKRLFIGGDRIPNQLLGKLQKVFNGAEIVVTYGPTEATICSTGYFYKTSSEHEPNGAIIGVPDDNSSIYIVDEDLNIQPKGVIGEICIGGAGVAKGYLNREDLTAEKFINSPFVQGDRVYRTGDLGRWTFDNQIEFIGRLDDQVKIRGYRIELGEIEYSIAQMENVEQVVVIAVDHPQRSEKELVAYLTTIGQESKIDSTALRSRLKEKLPDYMIPTYFMELSSIPLTDNGKVDRRNLPVIGDLFNDSRVEYVAPNTEIEKQLVAIWEEVLERQNIGIQDDFFELGGHSLKALRLIMSIKQQFDVKLEVKQLFQNTTIQLLAQEIDRIAWLSKGAEEDESNLDIIEI